MLLLFSVGLRRSCITKSRESNFVADYGVHRHRLQRLLYKVLVNDILVRLKRMLDYAGVRLERFDCTLEPILETICIEGHFPKTASYKFLMLKDCLLTHLHKGATCLLRQRNLGP